MPIPGLEGWALAIGAVAAVLLVAALEVASVRPRAWFEQPHHEVDYGDL